MHHKGYKSKWWIFQQAMFDGRSVYPVVYRIGKTIGWETLVVAQHAPNGPSSDIAHRESGYP